MYYSTPSLVKTGDSPLLEQIELKALGFFFDFIPPTALAMNIINWGVLLVGSNCFNLFLGMTIYGLMMS
jgi:hypothetical protein